MMRNLRLIYVLIWGMLSPAFMLAQSSTPLRENIQLASIAIPVMQKPEKMHQQAGQILAQMHQHVHSLTTHSYRLKVEERRIGNKMHQGEMLISVSNRPLSVKLEIVKPNSGALVEYNAAKDKQKAVVTPRKWLPAMTFKRDIHGSLLRPGHYAINETSLTHIANIIAQCEKLFKERGIYQQSVRYWGRIRLGGNSCHKIELLDHGYQLLEYEVQKGEDLLSIAKKQFINPYKIRELNPEVRNYFDVAPGQRIRIPSSYSKRCVIYVDQHTHLPQRLELFDENGCFERYSFMDIKGG